MIRRDNILEDKESQKWVTRILVGLFNDHARLTHTTHVPRRIQTEVLNINVEAKTKLDGKENPTAVLEPELQNSSLTFSSLNATEESGPKNNATSALENATHVDDPDFGNSTLIPGSFNTDDEAETPGNSTEVPRNATNNFHFQSSTTMDEQVGTTFQNETSSNITDSLELQGSVNTSTSPEKSDEENSDGNDLHPGTDKDSTLSVLETVLTGSNENNGAMFDVSTREGNHEVKIVSVDIHTNLIQADCPLLVFGRPGSHVGFENTTEGWKLLVNGTINCLGLGAFSHIPSSLFEEAPILRGGEAYAFYTYMPTRSVRYTNGTAVGAIFSSSKFLSIHEGTGVSELFGGSGQSFDRPRVWNGAVKYLVMKNRFDEREEFIEGCATNLTTSFIDNLGSYGNMFDIKTFESSITVNGLDFYTDLTEPVVFEIFTRVGTYEDGLYRSEAGNFREGDLNSTMPKNVTNVEIMRDLNWTLVKRGETIGRGSGMGTPVRNFAPFSVPPNSFQGFYVTLTQPDMRYRDISEDIPGATVGDIYFQDDDVQIQIGVSVGTYPASQLYYGPRAWSGSIIYTASHACPSEAPSEMSSIVPTITPSQAPSLSLSQPPSSSTSHVPSLLPSLILPDFGNCTDTSSLPTTMAGGTGSYGNMFTVSTKERISITTMEINASTENRILVSVYTKRGDYKGFEEDAFAWTLVASTNLTGSGNGVPTLIPDDVFTDVHAAANETIAFYVTLSTADIKYTRTSTAVGVALTSDSFLSINAGAGLAAADFGGSLFEPRVFNGAVHYRHNDDCTKEATTTVVFNFNIKHDESLRMNDLIVIVNDNVRETVTALIQIDDTLREFNANYDLEPTNFDSVLSSRTSCSSLQDGERCSPIETHVTFSHKPTLKPGNILFTMLQYKDTLSINLDLLPEFQAEYDGDVPIQSDVVVSLGGNFTGNLTDEEMLYFESITQAYLKEQLSKLGVNVLNVAVASQSVENRLRYLQRHDDDEVRPSSGSIDITTVIDGAYRPPPDVDFSAIVEDAIDADGGTKFQDDLRNGRRDVEQEIMEEPGAFQTVSSVRAVAMSPQSTASPSVTPITTVKGTPSAALYGGILGGLATLFLLLIWRTLRYKKKNEKAKHDHVVDMKGALGNIKWGMFCQKSSKGLCDENVLEATCTFVSDPYLQKQYPTLPLIETTPGGSTELGGFQDEWNDESRLMIKPQTTAGSQFPSRSLTIDALQNGNEGVSYPDIPLVHRAMDLYQQQTMKSMASVRLHGINNDRSEIVGNYDLRPGVMRERGMVSMRNLSTSPTGMPGSMGYASMGSIGNAMGYGYTNSKQESFRNINGAIFEGRRTTSPGHVEQGTRKSQRNLIYEGRRSVSPGSLNNDVGLGSDIGHRDERAPHWSGQHGVFHNADEQELDDMIAQRPKSPPLSNQPAYPLPLSAYRATTDYPHRDSW